MKKRIISLALSAAIMLSPMTTNVMAVSGDGLIEVLDKVNSHPLKGLIMGQLKSNIGSDKGIDNIKSLVDLGLSSDDKASLEKKGITTSDIYSSLDDLKTWEVSSRMELLKYVENGQADKAKELMDKNGVVEKETSTNSGSSSSSSNVEKETTKPQPKPEVKPQPQPKPEIEIKLPTKFNDINGHWAEANIKKMSELKIVNGISADKFAPEQSVTRSQMAAFIVRMLDINTDNGNMPFTDVKPGSWDYDAIRAAYEAKIVSGTSSTTFEPNKNITREQMMVMMMNGLKYKNIQNMNSKNKALTDYKDHNKVSIWANDSMVEALKMGLITGKTESTIEPQGVASRSEAVTILVRAYELLGR